VELPSRYRCRPIPTVLPARPADSTVINPNNPVMKTKPFRKTPKKDLRLLSSPGRNSGHQDWSNSSQFDSAFPWRQLVLSSLVRPPKAQRVLEDPAFGRGCGSGGFLARNIRDGAGVRSSPLGVGGRCWHEHRGSCDRLKRYCHADWSVDVDQRARARQQPRGQFPDHRPGQLY